MQMHPGQHISLLHIVWDHKASGIPHLLIVMVVKVTRGSINLPLQHPQAMAQRTGSTLCEVPKLAHPWSLLLCNSKGPDYLGVGAG